MHWIQFHLTKCLFRHIIKYVFWDIGSKRPVGISIQKAWNLTFAYSPTCGTGKNLVSKNKQLTPTPEYECHQTEPSRRMLCRRDIHIPKGVYCLLALDRLKFSRFLVTKTSANKRFLICLQPIARLCDCKSTTFFWIEQENSNFSLFYFQHGDGRVWIYWILDASLLPIANRRFTIGVTHKTTPSSVVFLFYHPLTYNLLPFPSRVHNGFLTGSYYVITMRLLCDSYPLLILL